MLMDISKMLFITSMVVGTVISISSNSWLGAWMGLEMNLLSFIPLMNKDKSPYENEASMKYFLVQAIASIMVLFSITINNAQPMEDIKLMEYTIMLALLMKMGAAPLHMWFPGVMQGLSWYNCFILMTWQKIAPMILTSYMMHMNVFSTTIIITGVMVGAVGGVNQTSTRKLMAYSSISHLGWMISAMLMSDSYWVMYFLLYSALNLPVVMIMMKSKFYQISQMFNQKMSSNEVNFTLFISMLSLGGLPPFLGFLPKWLIIQNMINVGQYLLIVTMVMSTLITLFFYLRIMFSALMFVNITTEWKKFNNQEYSLQMAVGMSLLGIPMLMTLSLL